MKRGKREFAGIGRRFMIEPIEASFYVRDANAITDEEVRRGLSSPVVACFGTLVEAREFCQEEDQ